MREIHVNFRSSFGSSLNRQAEVGGGAGGVGSEGRHRQDHHRPSSSRNGGGGGGCKRGSRGGGGHGISSPCSTTSAHHRGTSSFNIFRRLGGSSSKAPSYRGQTAGSVCHQQFQQSECCESPYPVRSHSAHWRVIPLGLCKMVKKNHCLLKRHHKLTKIGIFPKQIDVNESVPVSRNVSYIIRFLPNFINER